MRLTSTGTRQELFAAWPFHFVVWVRPPTANPNYSSNVWLACTADKAKQKLGFQVKTLFEKKSKTLIVIPSEHGPPKTQKPT